MDFGSKNFFQFQKCNLRLLGITVSSDGKFIVSRVTIFLAFMPFFLPFGLMYRALENTGSLEIFSESMAPVMVTALGLIKLFTFILRQSPLTKLLQKLWTLSQEVNKKEFEVIINENKKDTRISKFYTICVYLSSTLAAIAPFILSLVHYAQTGQFVHILPFEGNFIFDVSKFYNYCFLYGYHLTVIYIISFSILSFDSLFSWYIHNIVAHFRVIQEKLKFIFKSDFQNQTEIEKAFRSIIIYHQITLEMAKEIDRLYKPIVFAEFAFSSIQLCLIAFQLVQGVAWANVPFLVAFLVVIFTQMIIYCIGGQRLHDESLEIGAKFYEAINWTKAGMKHRKMLVLPILRAQKPCTIKAVFFTVNLGLFVEVVKTAGSYVALMKSLEDQS